MLKIIKLLWAYRNMVMIGAAVIGLLGAAGYFYLKGRADCKNAHQVKSLTETVKLQEAFNEIRNNRPDDAALIDSLRRGTF